MVWSWRKTWTEKVKNVSSHATNAKTPYRPIDAQCSGCIFVVAIWNMSAIVRTPDTPAPPAQEPPRAGGAAPPRAGQGEGEAGRGEHQGGEGREVQRQHARRAERKQHQQRDRRQRVDVARGRGREHV